MSPDHLVAALCSLALLAPTGLAVAGGRPFTADDLVAMQRISDPQPSPDGRRVAFVVTTMDLEANRGRKDLWLAAMDGSWERRLTTQPENDASPRWADDHTLYFLSERSGSSQVWRMSPDGGEARPVTSLPLEVTALRVVPGGGALVVAMDVFPDCTDPVAGTAARLAEGVADKATGHVYDRLFVRHWDTWEDGRRSHLFRIPLAADGSVGGDPVDLMPGVDGNCPDKPFGDEADFALSPDGHWLVYAAKVVPGSEQAWSTNSDLWAVPLDGSASPRCLTEANPAWDGAPAFSSDGATLAYLAMTRPGYESDRRRVVLLDWPDGGRRVLTEGWDRSPGDLAWAADGSALYASADNIGNHSIFRIDTTTGSVTAVATLHTNNDPRPLPGGTLLFSRDSLTAPVELYTISGPGGEEARVTHLNDRRLADLEFGSYEQFSFVGAHGDQVFGYLIHPAGFDPKRTYPLAFLIHGGPQGTFDDHWHYRWNPQVYACHGYATVMIDFHGSTGYGQAFTDAIRDDWGGAPFEDLMKGLDDVLRRHRWIDPGRMAAAGASFGGYMINWIQGHTDRFAALVCHDGNLDETMAYYDTEELWFPEWEHRGTPWSNPEGYRSQSPERFVASWKTPELVIHGAKDYRVALTQGLGTFTALQRLGIPSRLLYYPDENHWVLKPANSLQWHRVVLEWMDRWTAAGAGE